MKEIMKLKNEESEVPVHVHAFFLPKPDTDDWAT